MLSYLSIHALRNIDVLQLTLHPRFHVISGPNGSGKTSILEAIYLLSCARSFRTRESVPLIQHQQDVCTVFARTLQQDTVSIQKTRQGDTKVKINQQPCLRSSDLAHFIPCQLFYQDAFQIIDAGPSLRRNVLDWGLFHVEHTYHALWKEYRNVLKQRNALLRQKAPREHFTPWNSKLCELADMIETLRQSYVQPWFHLFYEYLSKLSRMTCTLGYYKGWDKKNSGRSLLTVLNEQYEIDLHRQYTHSGPHQADIYFGGSVLTAKQMLSRGQQKIVLLALKLAQAHMLSVPCLYLLDDLHAEIDTTHLRHIFETLMNVRGQFIITTLDEDSMTRMMHPFTASDVGYTALHAPESYHHS